MIPKIIHYCWYGNKPLPENYKAFIEGWKALMPDYTIMLWNEKNSPMELKYLKRAYNNKKWANLSNIVRLHAVYNYGGIYLDTDVEVVKRFDSILDKECFFGYQLASHDSVNNAIFGAEKNHWFIKQQLDAIQELYDGIETEYLSSPHLTTFLLRQNGFIGNKKSHADNNSVVVYPYDYFYPYSWLEQYDKSCVTKNTFAIHHWSGSWAMPKVVSNKTGLLKGLHKIFK